MENNPISDGKIEIIVPTAIVSIKMSAGFYRRVQMATMFIAADKSAEELKSAHDQIKSGNITEEWVSVYETMLILCKEFETMAVNEKQTKFVTPEELTKLMEESNPTDTQSDEQ